MNIIMLDDYRDRTLRAVEYQLIRHARIRRERRERIASLIGALFLALCWVALVWVMLL